MSVRFLVTLCIVGLLPVLPYGQAQSLTAAQLMQLLANQQQAAAANNLAQTSLTNSAFNAANVAAQTVDQTTNLLEQQNAANIAANFATARTAAQQAQALADQQALSVRLLTEQMQREAAEQAAAEAARARVAAVQAVVNAQRALEEAGQAAVDSEMTFRGQFPGRCTGPGIYYHDTTSYYICDALQHHLYQCRSGFKAGILNSYTLGHTYNAKTYCNHKIEKVAAAVSEAAVREVVAPGVGSRGAVGLGPRALGPRGLGPRGLIHDPITEAHSAVPHLHSRGFRRHPKAMTVTTQSHSQTHGGVTHTVQKHVRTISDGRSYSRNHVADHSLGGLGGGPGKGDVNNGPVYHYHFYYDKNGRKRRVPGPEYEYGGKFYDGPRGPRGPPFDDFDGPYPGPGPYHEPGPDFGPRRGLYHGLIPPH